MQKVENFRDQLNKQLFGDAGDLFSGGKEEDSGKNSNPVFNEENTPTTQTISSTLNNKESNTFSNETQQANQPQQTQQANIKKEYKVPPKIFKRPDLNPVVNQQLNSQQENKISLNSNDEKETSNYLNISNIVPNSNPISNNISPNINNLTSNIMSNSLSPVIPTFNDKSLSTPVNPVNPLSTNKSLDEIFVGHGSAQDQ